MLQSVDNIQEVYSSETVDEGLSKILASMSATLKLEILHYAEYLSQKNAGKDILTSQNDSEFSQQQQVNSKTLFGSMKETFVLPLHDDFDETEEKYGYGSLAGKITMSDDFDEPLEDLQEYM
jgi:hypothetical protein